MKYQIFDWASLFSFVKKAAKLGPTPIDGVYVSELLFAKTNSKLKSEITKGNNCFKKGAWELEKY